MVAGVLGGDFGRLGLNVTVAPFGIGDGFNSAVTMPILLVKDCDNFPPMA